MKPCHTILYARKSSEEDDRQALSLDAQEKECRAYAARHGVEISEVVREAHSARRPGRPQFTEMLRRCEALGRRTIPVRVLCHKPDRLLRNLADWARINDLMDGGVEFVFVSGSYPNNAQGKMAFGINVVFAKYYVDNLSEEVKKGFREKIERGEWPHVAPLGYKNENRRIVLDPVRAPLVRKAFEYYATGSYSLASLGEALHAEGLGGRRLGRKLTKNVLATHVLSNPFYCGMMRTGGRLYPAAHPPLVTTELFERVQGLLHGSSRPRTSRRSFRFGGLLTCGACGAAVIGDVKKGRYVYYRCSHKRGPCAQGYVREEAVEAQLKEALSGRIVLPLEVGDALREAAAVLEREAADLTSQQAPLERRLAELKRKASALVDLRLEGTVDASTYVEKREELSLEEARVRERLQALSSGTPDYRARTDWFLATCDRLSGSLEKFEREEFQRLLRIVGSNYQLRDKKIDFEPVKPFNLALQIRNRPVWRDSRDEVATFISLLLMCKQTAK